MSTQSFCIAQAQVYGCTEEHIVWLSDRVGIHREVQNAWQQLCIAAKAEGFELCIASGFRSMQRQQLIWERKLSGAAPVYNAEGIALDISAYDVLAKAHAVMRFSALPGASRHHWGTDIDIYDKAAIPAGYKLQLIPDEYTGEGLFTPMCAWLDDYLKQPASPDFFLPYQADHGGVAVEPWHLSYRPVASVYQQHWSASACCDYLARWEHPQAQVLINAMDALYDRYIKPSLIIA